MARKGWSTVEVPNGWFQITRGPRPPSARTATSASDWEFQSEGSNTPDSTVSIHSSTRKEHPRTSQIRCIHASEQGNLADGDVEEKQALELALHKAQKQAVERPLAHTGHEVFCRQGQETDADADEKIRLAQVALQEAMDEKDYDIRELPSAEVRLEKLQKKVVTPRHAPPVPAPSASDLETEVQRLRTQMAQMQVVLSSNVAGRRLDSRSRERTAQLQTAQLQTAQLQRLRSTVSNMVAT